MKRPGRKLVGLICDREISGGMASHQVGEEYIRAVRDGVGAEPLLIPAGEPVDAAALLARLDGLLVPGAPSNVAPWRYGGEAPRVGTKQDEARDAMSLALIAAAVAGGVPLLCICRGFQELNVALGGTLHQHVHELAGALDHREDEAAPLDTQYAPAHRVSFTPGGMLAGLAGAQDAMVNSLHHQGIARLAPGLTAEAHAPDGLIEAVSLPGAQGFLLGVQWHPEWDHAGDPLSRTIFGAFAGALAV